MMRPDRDRMLARCYHAHDPMVRVLAILFMLALPCAATQKGERWPRPDQRVECGPCRIRRGLRNRGGVVVLRRHEHRGVGVLDGRVVTVDWGDATPVIYVVMEDGELHGTWADGTALEKLTPR